MSKVMISGIDTAALPKLSARECDELLVKIKCGDKDAKDLFLLANISALPRMIQFTTIRGRNIPRALSKAGE